MTACPACPAAQPGLVALVSALAPVGPRAVAAGRSRGRDALALAVGRVYVYVRPLVSFGVLSGRVLAAKLQSVVDVPRQTMSGSLVLPVLSIIVWVLGPRFWKSPQSLARRQNR